jgi:hypothetical protein
MTALKGQVRYYEIWNEPDAGYLATGAAIERAGVQSAGPAKDLYKNNDDYWLGDRYVPLVIAAREVADEVDGDRIDILGPSWNHDYYGNRGKLCFDRGMYRYLQLYSIHNYVGDPHSYVFWEELTNGLYMKTTEDLFKTFNAPLPIAVTEWGVRTYDQPAPGNGFRSRRDGQIFLIKSTFDYLAMERVPILILHQLGYNDEWSLVNKKADGTFVYLPTFDTYQWLCKTFDGKSYRRVALSVEAGPTARGFAIHLADDAETYVAVWQNPTRIKDGLQPVDARQAVIKLSGLDGTYTMEQLDLAGNVTESHEVKSTAAYEWTASLPQATTAAESEPIIYRLRAKK